jgi:UDP-N-acetylglucosamine 2-epimerase (non-hydrolysing)
MPEEINRLVTDRLADLLLTPSRDADENLRHEGVEPERIVFVGNVMVDTLLHGLARASVERMREQLGVAKGEYVLVTIHRPSSVDIPGPPNSRHDRPGTRSRRHAGHFSDPSAHEEPLAGARS